jgi:aerobic-type carbon monoxide dehydrogenase small subunit (CoxS/CutS family)
MTDPIRLTVNGAAREVAAAPDTPLLWVLRETLDLKSTRFGCGAESCGACTVLVDGAPRFACTLPLSEAAGAKVLTAESLEGGDDGGAGDHPLLTAFLHRQAGQCGYCLPGILMRARALLEAGGPVDRAGAAAALDVNLCRCGAHGRILDAVMDAARRMGVAE